MATAAFSQSFTHIPTSQIKNAQSCQWKPHKQEKLRSSSGPCDDIFGGLQWKISNAIKNGKFEKVEELLLSHSDKKQCFSCDAIKGSVKKYATGNAEATRNMNTYLRNKGYDSNCKDIPQDEGRTPPSCESLYEKDLGSWSKQESEYFASNNCCQQKKQEVLGDITTYQQSINGSQKEFMGIGSYNFKKSEFDKLEKLGCFSKCELSPDQFPETSPGSDQLSGANYQYPGCEVRPTISQIESYKEGMSCSSGDDRNINMDDYIFYTLADLDNLVEVMKEDPERFNQLVEEKIKKEELCPDIKLVINNYSLPGGNVTDAVKISASLHGSDQVHFNCFKKGKGGDLPEGKTDNGTSFPICCDEERKAEYLSELESLGITFASACKPETHKIEESGSTPGKVNLKYLANCGGDEDFVIFDNQKFPEINQFLSAEGPGHDGGEVSSGSDNR